LTICIHLADYSIDHEDEKGTRSFMSVYL
jgi:hypothetical protein